MGLKQKIVDLYKKTSVELPKDVVFALEKAKDNENNPVSKEILEKILENVKLAKNEEKSICQDTGTPIFYIKHPKEYSQKELKRIIDEATDMATSEIPLRPNAVDSLADRNIGNKAVLHFEESEELQIDLMLKGGGSENVSAIYKLPNLEINGHRNLDGVRRCVIDAVFKAQGKGCPPYLLGVAIGGSIEDAAYLSKKQLLKKIDDINPVTELESLEQQILKDVNKLNIGPLGLGGETTALAVKIFSGLRHPATFFVGVSVGCWCLRRGRGE